MGPLVADASAIADFIAAGERATPFDQHLRSASELHAPEVCDVEVLSAIRRLGHEIGSDDARDLLIDYVRMPLRRHRHAPLLGRAFELRHNFSSADAFYVALAERLGARFLTADRRLAEAVGRHTAVTCLP